MRRAFVVAGLVGAALSVLAAPAVAVPPQQNTMEFAVDVEDLDGDQCGFPVRWEIRGTLNEKRFFDREGNLTRIQVHISEENTLTNLETGRTVRDSPTFNQQVHFNPDGSLSSVATVGQYANAGQGADRVMDVGRVVIAVADDGTRTWVFSAGRHPLREESLVGAEPWIAAFCHLLE